MPFAQQVDRYKNGLTRLEYTLPEGSLIVYLPELSPLSLVSGTITYSPQGKNSKEKNDNLRALKTYNLMLGDKDLQNPGPFFPMVVSDSPTGRIVSGIKTKEGKILFQVFLPLAETTVNFHQKPVPSYLVAGEPAAFSGYFNGNLNDSRLLIRQQPAELLAESSGKLYFKTPDHLEGPVQLECSEAGQTLAAETQALQLHASVGKTDLTKGERTVLRIEISGLNGLKEPVPLSIVNLDPATISLQGGNSREILIDPQKDAQAGVYNASIPIQSLQRGNFNIAVQIAPPGDGAGREPLLCNCRIDENTYLLPPNICQAFGGTCSSSGQTQEFSKETHSSAAAAPLISLQVPPEITHESGVALIRVNPLFGNLAGVRLSYRPFGETNWTAIVQDSEPSDGWGGDWLPPLGYDGAYALRVQVVNQADSSREHIGYTQVLMTPPSLFPATEGERVLTTISQSEIDRALENAARIGENIRQEQDRLAELRRKAQALREQEEANRLPAEELKRIDRTLDQIPGIYWRRLRELADSLDRMRDRTPNVVDTAALNRAVDDAQNRLKACQDRLDALKKEQKDLEGQRDDLKKQLDEALDQMDRIHLNNGWTGRHGFHPDGRYWYGYIGDENSNTDIKEEVYAIQKKLRALQKTYLATLNRLKNLPGEIEQAQADCAELEKALQEALAAARDGNQFAGTNIEIAEICREIRSLVNTLRRWCAAHPGQCPFTEALGKLLEDCPKSGEELDDFINGFNDALDRKRELERALEKAADDQEASATEVDAEAQAAEERIRALEEEQRRAYAEAERKRQQLAKELEEARRRERQQREQEERARRTPPPPQPLLDEPVDPSDDELKFHAQLLFRELYLDLLISHGPCDCKTMAVALANNTNSIIRDLIGRLGVGVFFAPLEALPGVSLGARLALGAAKALASALFGGQNISEEMTKNLFSVIGGEIFPKLVGNEFTGNRLNDLAGKGLEAILEAEGVRAISWEGSTRLRDCGEVKGKTTLLVNPNTGWVTILIKIDNCPLIVIKYRINDDGVPVGKASITEVKE